MSEGGAWTHVGRLADVLQVLTVLAGLVLVGLTVAGVDVLSDPSDQTLVIGAIVLGISGLIAIVSAVVRVQRPTSGFVLGERATIQWLYVIGAVLLVLSLATVALLVLRDPRLAAESCPTP